MITENSSSPFDTPAGLRQLSLLLDPNPTKMEKVGQANVLRKWDN
jgi:hypothetical protein